MKVWISNYRHHWYSPYTWFDYLFFWTDWSKCSRSRGIIPDDRWVDRPQWVDRWAERLEPISRGIMRVLDVIHPRIQYVRIDPWDTWSMDHTLAMIVVPMLRQLRAVNHGAPLVDDEDVPEHLRSTAAPPRENEWDTDANHFLRWDWVMDEMIFAFETKLNDNYIIESTPEDRQRVSNGFRLFGKYYQGLWD